MPKKKRGGGIKGELGKKEGGSVFRGDLIPQCTLWLRKIVKAINNLHRDDASQVLTPGGDSGVLYVFAGVLKRDTHVPYDFIIALDYALKKATQDPKIWFMLDKYQSSWQMGAYITETDFAGDIALITNYVE